MNALAISDGLFRRLQARGIHYAWAVLVVTFLYSLAASTAMTVPSVLVVPIANEFGWGLGDVSSAMALRLFLFGAMAPFAGAFLVKYGLRRMMLVSGSLSVIGLILAITMTSKFQLWLSLGVVLGVAPGLTALVVTAAVGTRWFAKRRGLAIGVLTASIATGQLLFLPVAAWLSDHWGWRMALVPTAVAVALCTIVYALIARDNPSDLGITAFGETEPPPRRPALTGGNALAISFSALRDASGSPAFWVLFGSFFVCGLSSYGLMGPHFVPLCADFGVTAVTAASLLAVMGVCDFFGTIGSGWLSDRYDSRWLLSWYYGLRGLSLIWLPFSGFTMFGLSIFAVFFGLDYIATVPPSVKIAAQAFGRDRAPVVFGWIFAGHQLGAAVMASAAGIVRDDFATYLPSFFAAGVFCMFASASMLVLLGKRNPARTAPAIAAGH
ncbi:MAG TPA: MFS transporter [Stellaceae bacterium]|nr:MFS transporter [Stellaceae bacterium]